MNKVITILTFLLWMLFLPNTIYVFTDVHHLIEQWPHVDDFVRTLLVVQYAIFEIIGLTCFLIAFYPVEKILQQFGFKGKSLVYGLILMNFILGFALVIGKFDRVNSWDIFLNPMFVITSTLQVVMSYEMWGLVILFGLFANFFYFLFRKKAKKLYGMYIK